MLLLVACVRTVCLCCYWQCVFEDNLSVFCYWWRVRVFEDTLSVAGGNWPSTLALWMVDGLTWKTCQPGSLSCDTHAQVEVSGHGVGGSEQWRLRGGVHRHGGRVRGHGGRVRGHGGRVRGQ